MKMQILVRMLLTVFMVVFISASVFSQKDEKAAEIVETMQEEYVKSIEGVDDYIIYKENHTIYYKKAYEEGKPYFKTKTVSQTPGGMTSVISTDLFSQTYSYFKNNSIHKGVEKMNGNKVHVLYAEDVKFQTPQGEESVEYVQVYIDLNNKVTRKIKYPFEMEKDGQKREVTSIMKYRDFREIEGMLIPYETVRIYKGLTLTKEEQREAEKSLEEFDKKMENMPESRRKMIENMMGDKIAKYRKMIKENKIKEIEKVRKVEVNTDMQDF